MDEVEPVTDNDERKLVGKLGLLEEVLNFLGVVRIRLATDTLNLTDLASTGSGLDVLEVDLWILAKVDDRTEVVVETWMIMSGKIQD